MNDPRQHLELQLSAYLDDELDHEQRRAVEALLATDENARALLAQLQATVEAVRSLPRLRASDQFVESLRSRMERQSLLDSRPVPMHMPVTHGRSYFRWTAAAAVLALTVTAGYLMWSLAHDRIGKPIDQYVRVDAPKTSPVPDATALGDTESPSALPPDLARSPTTGQPGALAAGRTGTSEERLRPPAQRGKEESGAPADVALNGRPAPLAVGKPGEEADSANLVARGVKPEGTREIRQGPLAGVDHEPPGPLLFGAPPKLLNDKLDMGSPFVLGELKPPSPGVAGQVAPPTAVVELAFADADSQQEAMQLLRDEYAFQPAAPADREGRSLQILARQVPDQAVARDVVASVERSLNEAQILVVYSTLEVDALEDASALAKRARNEPLDATHVARGRGSAPAPAAAPSQPAPPVEANKPTTPLAPTVKYAPAPHDAAPEPVEGNAEKARTPALAEPPAEPSPAKMREADETAPKGERADRAKETEAVRPTRAAGAAPAAPTTRPASSDRRAGSRKPDGDTASRPADRRFLGGPRGGMGGGFGGFGGFGGADAMGKHPGSRPAPDEQVRKQYDRGGGRFGLGAAGEDHRKLDTQPADEPAAHVIRLYVWVETPATQPTAGDEPPPATSPASQPAPAD